MDFIKEDAADDFLLNERIWALGARAKIPAVHGPRSVCGTRPEGG